MSKKNPIGKVQHITEFNIDSDGEVQDTSRVEKVQRTSILEKPIAQPRKSLKGKKNSAVLLKDIDEAESPGRSNSVASKGQSTKGGGVDEAEIPARSKSVVLKAKSTKGGGEDEVPTRGRSNSFATKAKDS